MIVTPKVPMFVVIDRNGLADGYPATHPGGAWQSARIANRRGGEPPTIEELKKAGYRCFRVETWTEVDS